MRILNQSSEVWGECPLDFESAVLWIERAGRVCYRSEDKIVDGSGLKFVNNIIKRKHYSVIEHSNIVVRTKDTNTFPVYILQQLRARFSSNYFYFTIENDYVYIAGNWRAWLEFLSVQSIEEVYAILSQEFYIVNNLTDVPMTLKAVTVSFLTDRAVTHELVRHRPCAISQESQRYCAYRQDLCVILPYQYEQGTVKTDTSSYKRWIQCVEYNEKTYKTLLASGSKPEQARAVLPNCTATNIVLTAYVPEWEHIFKLRCSKAAYPGIRYLMQPVQSKFEHMQLGTQFDNTHVARYV